jgi:hypothetical protein
MEVNGGTGIIAPRILKLGISCRWIASNSSRFTPEISSGTQWGGGWMDSNAEQDGLEDNVISYRGRKSKRDSSFIQYVPLSL